MEEETKENNKVDSIATEELNRMTFLQIFNLCRRFEPLDVFENLCERVKDGCTLSEKVIKAIEDIYIQYCPRFPTSIQPFDTRPAWETEEEEENRHRKENPIYKRWVECKEKTFGGRYYAPPEVSSIPTWSIKKKDDSYTNPKDGLPRTREELKDLITACIKEYYDNYFLKERKSCSIELSSGLDEKDLKRLDDYLADLRETIINRMKKDNNFSMYATDNLTFTKHFKQK